MRQRALWVVRHCAAIILTASWGCAGDDALPHEDDMHEGGTPDGGDPELDAARPDVGHMDASDDASDRDADEADAADDAATDAPADHEPPQLVESNPSDGDDNVASDGVHELVFSEPIVVGEGALRLRSSAASGDLDFSAELSDDGLRIELTFGELPELPVELTLELGAEITDLAGNPLVPTDLQFTIPIWLGLGEALARNPLEDATDVKLAVDAEGRVVLLSVEAGDVYASRWEDGAWTRLGAALNTLPTLASPGAEPRIALAIDATGAPLAAFREDAAVVVQRWDGTSWDELGDVVDPNGGGTYAPALALGADQEPVVAFDALGSSSQPVLRVRALSGATWQTLADLDVEARGVRLAGEGQGEVTLAVQESGTGISVSRWNGSNALSTLGGAVTLPAASGSFALSAVGGQGCTLTAQGQGTVDWTGSAWSSLPEDLGFLVSSQAADRVIAHDADGALLAAFSETPSGLNESRVYAQRFVDARRQFQPLGPALNREPLASAARPALAVTSAGQPIVAWLETPAAGGAAQIFVSRFNGDPSDPPHGLRARAFDPACLASAPLDGSSLVDTGCFEDALGLQPVDAFIPFDVRSPLWTDGAFKRRFVMLPSGTSITYRDPGIWTLPAGSILIKEFSIEGRRGDPSTLRPVETRFLVVRDGATWERYSYQWNQDATDALLRVEAPATGVVSFNIEDESGDPAAQDHFYPNRAACLACHQAPGTVLGLQTAMLNRNLDYGATVDNQLRSLQQLGVFGDAVDASDLEDARFMPNPTDTTYSTERRLRAYLHANCTSCHQPLAGMDLRIHNATLDTGLCTKITKGDLQTSLIYWRDVLRGSIGQPGTAPMPPLGTLVTNPVIETLLTDWILDPTNVCP